MACTDGAPLTLHLKPPLLPTSLAEASYASVWFCLFSGLQSGLLAAIGRRLVDRDIRCQAGSASLYCSYLFVIREHRYLYHREKESDLHKYVYVHIYIYI